MEKLEADFHKKTNRPFKSPTTTQLMYKTKYIVFAFDILQGIWRERGFFEQHKPELDNGAYHITKACAIGLPRFFLKNLTNFTLELRPKGEGMPIMGTIQA